MDELTVEVAASDLDAPWMTKDSSIDRSDVVGGGGGRQQQRLRDGRRRRLAPDATTAAGRKEALAVTVAGAGDEGGGPAIILGSFQQQNYLVEYDLEKERLGFRRQPCASSS